MPTAIMHLPFSVPIFEFELEKEYVDMINDWADEIQKDAAKSKQLDWSDNLVGNVVQEHAIEDHIWLQSPDGRQDNLLQYMQVVTTHFIDQVYGKLPNEPYSYRNKSKGPDISQLQINTSWIVNQVAGDFNPPHMHYGHLSCAGWLKVPDSITNDEEKDEAGYFEFVKNDPNLMQDTKYPIKPAVGKFVMFPAWLQHMVYPFRGEGLRRSMSFNWVFNQSHPKKEK
jgi:hypothetical protein